MSVNRDSVKQLCKNIALKIAKFYPGLQMHFIIHGKSDFNEMLALSEHEIVLHPASAAGQAIIRKQATSSQTSFLGLAIHQKKSMMGLKTEDRILALFNLNVDDLETENEAKAALYRLVWHAIDLHDIRKEPKYKKKFASGPMVPKRSDINLSKANMQSSIFAALMMEMGGQAGCIDEIAKQGALRALKTNPNIKPEEHPFLIASDACQLALKELQAAPPSRQDMIKACRDISVDIGRAFDQMSIKQWWNFAKPAQDMAWRGFSKEDILGAAINTCDDTYVRATGLMVSGLTGLSPSPAAALEYAYNSFLDTKALRMHHDALVDTVFEEVMNDKQTDGGAKGRALMLAANRQNENLSEGHILGWCANALQEAAKAFENALSSGTSPEQAARMHFEGNKTDTSWDDLKSLGDSVVDQKRKGYAVTMGHIAEICHENPAFAPILGSLKMTMNDPGYLQQLEAANDLAMTPDTPALSPSTPAPKGPAPSGLSPKAPEAAPSAPSAAPPPPAAMPGLGGSSNTRRIMQERRRQQQQAAAQKDKADSTDAMTE